MADYIEYPEEKIRRVANDPGLWSALDGRRDMLLDVLAQLDALRARLAAVEAFCRDYPRSAKYPDYEGGYESALDDVLEVIAARGEETR